MKKKSIIIWGLISLFVLLGGIFLIDNDGQDKNLVIKDNDESVLQNKEDEEYELPINVPKNQDNKNIEEESSENSEDRISLSELEENTNGVASDNEQLSDLEKQEESEEQTDFKEEDDNTITNNNADIELPFVPAN